MEILVFKTSVDSRETVTTLTPMLDRLAGHGRWNFALDDCDHILRIASQQVMAEEAIRLLDGLGFQCVELD